MISVGESTRYWRRCHLVAVTGWASILSGPRWQAPARQTRGLPEASWCRHHRTPPGGRPIDRCGGCAPPARQLNRSAPGVSTTRSGRRCLGPPTSRATVVRHGPRHHERRSTVRASVFRGEGRLVQDTMVSKHRVPRPMVTSLA